MKALVALFGLSCALFAADPPDLGDLERKNAALEQRVRQLEAGALREAVAEYLAENLPAGGAEGAGLVVPGAISLRVSGEVRIREELKDRLYSPTDPAGAQSFDFAHMRTRLRFDVDIEEALGIVIEFQDVRTLGEEGSTIADAEGVDIKRAAIQIRKVGGRNVTLELGRFVMAYGEHRVIGHLEWFDQGRTYDGLRAMLKGERGFLDLFGVRVRETTTPDDDQYFVGIYGGTKGLRSFLDLEGYLLLFADDKPAAGEAGTEDTRFVTVGFRLFCDDNGGFDYGGEAMWQGGEVRGDDLSAFGVVLKGGYTFRDARWKPRIGVEFDFATGNESAADGETEQLQVLFPTNHWWYGYADLLGLSNVVAVRLSASAKPSERWILTLDLHHFRRESAAGDWVSAAGTVIRSGAAGSSRHLGEEIDFTATWKPRKGLSILFGYSVFFPGGFVEDTGDDPVSHFVYLEVRAWF